MWSLLGRYESWLTTARRMNGSEIARARAWASARSCGRGRRTGALVSRSRSRRRPAALFGAVHSRLAQAGTAAELRVREAMNCRTCLQIPRSNYRRWWNHPWGVIELGGQNRAGEWTAADDSRLRAFVSMAHSAGLWIRFYTLNGHDPSDTSQGWTPGYNFGSMQAAELRWEAAVRARVDFVAVDQDRRIRFPPGSRSRRCRHDRALLTV